MFTSLFTGGLDLRFRVIQSLEMLEPRANADVMITWTVISERLFLTAAVFLPLYNRKHDLFALQEAA